MHTQTFVAQCDEDYRLLNQLVSDTTDALGKTVRITTWFRPADGNIAPPPMTPEEVRCARLIIIIISIALLTHLSLRCAKSVLMATRSTLSIAHQQCAHT